MTAKVKRGASLTQSFDCSDEDEDEEGEAENEQEAQGETEAAGDPPGGGPKAEPEEPSLKKGPDDARGLHTYTVTELSSFDQKELLADSELLDGTCSPLIVLLKLMSLCRETEECQAQPQRPEGLSETRRGVFEACTRSGRGHAATR